MNEVEDVVEDVSEVSTKKNVKILNNSPSLGRIFRQRARLFWDTAKYGTYVKSENAK